MLSQHETPPNTLGLVGGSLAAKDTGIAVLCWRERDDPSLLRRSFSYLARRFQGSAYPVQRMKLPKIYPVVLLILHTVPRWFKSSNSLANGHVCGLHLFPNRTPQQERSRDVWLPDYVPFLQLINPIVILRNARGDIEVSLFLWPNFSTPDSP